MKRVIGLVIGVAALGLGGCASIVKGGTQQISVASPPAYGADCVLSSPLGSWNVTTPGIVEVERSKSDMQIRCAKPGFRDAVGIIPSGFEAWTLGNAIFGGLIGVGIDATTGALDQYPDAFQLQMVPVEAALTTTPLDGEPVPHRATGSIIRGDDPQLFPGS